MSLYDLLSSRMAMARRVQLACKWAVSDPSLPLNSLLETSEQAPFSHQNKQTAVSITKTVLHKDDCTLVTNYNSNSWWNLPSRTSRNTLLNNSSKVAERSFLTYQTMKKRACALSIITRKTNGFSRKDAETVGNPDTRPHCVRCLKRLAIKPTFTQSECLLGPLQ